MFETPKLNNGITVTRKATKNDNVGQPPSPHPPPRRRAATNKTRNWTHTHLIMLVMLISGLLTLFIGGLLTVFIALDIPNLRTLEEYRPLQTTTILDRHGVLIDRIFEQNRTLVPLNALPELLPKAFLAAEDTRFYEHGGVDAWSIARATLNNLFQGSRAQGGSTITQQVARALLLTPEKTYTRKIKEAILAYRIDRVFSKDEILQIYLNQIYFGAGAYGVEAAAQTYFGKHAGELDLAEIAILAGLPQAPSRYSPFKHFALAKNRQAYVLNRMAADGYITATAARKAFAQKLEWGSRFERNPDHLFYLQQVGNYVREKYGDNMLTGGGLTIHTNLDPAIQRAAALAVQNALTEWQERNQSAPDHEQPEAALIAIAHKTGDILAVTGGTDFNRSQFDRAVQARRQPGSAFKPIIYAVALNQGLTPGSIFIDEPISLRGGNHNRVWQPKNFSANYHGPTTLRDGLVFSRNIVTIKILQRTGIPPVTKLARNLGISSPLAADLSLALGTSEISLLELTAAYGAFANNGALMRPSFIDKITDAHGRELEKNQRQPRQVLPPQTAFQVTNLLEKVITEGTGRQARGLRTAAAGKTGTSDRNMDAWFIGYTPELVAGVWMGFDKKHSLGKQETGGRAAAPGWRHFMQQTGTSAAGQEFPMPAGVQLVPMNLENGEVTNENAEATSWEVYRINDLPASYRQSPEEAN